MADLNFSNSHVVFLALLGVAGSVIVFHVASKSRSRLPPPPPGPKGLPLVGNLNDLPTPGILEAHHWLEHKKLYGPLSSVSIFGQRLVIINDAELAFELLEKRSAKHSSRPKQIFAGEMVGWENSLGLSPYNSRFRAHRKNMSRIIGSKPAAAQYNDLQEAEVGHLLMHVLQSPDDLFDHIRRASGSVILKIAYGYTAESAGHDTLIDMAGDAMDKFARAAVPGAFMVDILPVLRYLPEWFPGAGFKKAAREWGGELTQVAEKPYAFVKQQLARGKDDKSFLARLLDAGDSTDEEKWTNKWSAMSLYVAGADTTVSSIECFFLAMILFPDVQRKAQEEVDRVVGTNRLPTIADRPALPYIEAVVKEVLRWHPVAPMALPHTSTEEDVIAGYSIPKGSILLANVWHFTHDPDVYDDPMAFMPERFLEGEGRATAPDPNQFVFGFGRRVCPGRLLADNALYLSIVQSLAVFKMGKAVEDGVEITPEVKFTPGIVSHPLLFKHHITPRSPAHRMLIESIEKTYPWEKSDGGLLEQSS